ncbi:MAG: hypothetical protein J6D11_07870 [Clostridia bacterium]|nr:hypothetical protein [Clostridia bacterium]
MSKNNIEVLTAAAFAKKAKKYFADCDNTVIPSAACASCKSDDDEACFSCRKKKTRPYTLSGLCLALGISKRQFNELKANKCFCNEVEMTLLKIEAYIEENCFSGNVNGTFALAILKENFGFGGEETQESVNISLSEEALGFAE